MATHITSSDRLATQSVYDSKWRIFTEWCRDTGQDLFTASAPFLGDFLTFLFSTKNFGPVTIAQLPLYIISKLERVTSQHLTDEQLLASLTNKFEAERPVPVDLPATGPLLSSYTHYTPHRLSPLPRLFSGLSLLRRSSW